MMKKIKERGIRLKKLKRRNEEMILRKMNQRKKKRLLGSKSRSRYKRDHNLLWIKRNQEIMLRNNQ
jgi:hypothetical protein